MTIQAQILELLKTIQERTRTAVVFITHDLGVIARIADRVQVMYAGRTAEVGDGRRRVRALASSVYTGGLLVVVAGAERAGARLQPITGSPPSMLFPPQRVRVPPAVPARAGDL